MRRIVTLAAATLLLAGAAAAQETSPTPGQPGPSASPGTATSSDNDPNNPAASRDASPSRQQMGTSTMGTTGSGATSGSQNNLTGPATKPAEKSPQRNDPTPDRQKNVQ